jgi:NSS family neurotransmitter:Na+ symporter
MSQRAQFATKLGVIAASVGSAVGLGNIWRFPYEAGMHGGGAFIFIYILCVLLLGIPVIIAEFVIGRSTHKNANSAIKQLAPGSKFRFVSYIGILASVMILSFYSVVAGWILEYLFQSIMGNLSGHTQQEYSEIFNSLASSPWRCTLWTALFLGTNFLILRKGIQKGIERISNFMMPILFLLLLIFCINSLLMPEAKKGLEFMFTPDFTQVSPSIIIGAMGQAFFSLSLGLTCLLTYASYFNNKTPLVKSATIIAILDTCVAILAGVIIFPAVFSFGAEPTAGPKLVFEVLPNIFQQMPGGYLWSVAFFVLLFFASITSTISMSEIFITFCTEEHKMSRKKATTLNTAIALTLGTLCALSFNVLSDITLFGKSIFDLFDYVSSNILLPAGGFILAVFVGWVMDKKIVKEQLTNDGTIKVPLMKPILFCIRYFAPIAIVLIFLYVIGVF